MIERKVRLEILLYFALFFLGVVAFVFFRVPSERLARVVLAHASTGGVEIEYDSVADTLLPGFRLEGVRLIDAASPKRAVLAELSSLGVRASLWPLVTGKLGVIGKAAGYGGEAEVHVANRGERTWVSGEVNHIDLDQIAALREKLSVPVRGSFDAEFDVEVYPTLERSVGNIDVILGNLQVGRGKLLGAFDFPGADFGDVHGTILLENAKLIFDRFSGRGQDVSASIEGDVALAEPLMLSRLDLRLNLKMSQRMEQSLGFAFPLLGLNKTPDGAYLRRVQGTLAAPR